jgi:hypothetical protein
MPRLMEVHVLLHGDRMRFSKCRHALLIAVACATIAAFAKPARAQIAKGDASSRVEEEESSRSWLDDADIVGPVRAGEGYSKIFHSPVVSMSFQDEITVTRIGKHARFHLVFGVDGYDADFWRDTPVHRSFLVVDGGAGVNAMLGPSLFSLSGTLGPGYTGANNNVVPDGFGFGARVEIFPFYKNVQDAVRCEGGWFSTYVLSGLSAWGQAREDFFGPSHGSMFAAGIGVDLARNIALPIMHKVITGRCGT